MDFLSSLRDDELRLKLSFYGFPNVPVTETTRPILIKKLYSEMRNEALKKNGRDLLENVTRRSNLMKCVNPRTSEIKSRFEDRGKRFNSSNYITTSRLPCSNKNKNKSMEGRKHIIAPPNIYSTLLASDSDEGSDDLYFSHDMDYSGSQNVALGSLKQSSTSPSLYNTNQVVGKLFKRLDTNEQFMSQDKDMRENQYTCKNNNFCKDGNKHVSVLTKYLIRGLKHLNVSYVLISSLLLFLLLISLKYALIRSELIDTIDFSKTDYKICYNSDAKNVLEPSLTCIENENVDSALDTVQLLLTSLQKRCEDHFCLNADKQLTLSAKDFFEQLYQQNSKENENKYLKDLYNAEYLIAHNLHWGISHVDVEGSKLSLEAVIEKRANQDYFFFLAKPKLPLRCTLQYKLQAYFKIIGTAFFIGFLTILLRYFYIFMRNRKIEKLSFLEDLTKKIIEELVYLSKKNEEYQEITVSNLREKIIPIEKRLEADSLWNEAVRKLELFDNRIQFGISTNNGEEFKTIKWIANLNNDHTCQNLCKKWQSPAFNKTNKILVPPTSCLKIRQMFDSSETENPNLKQILEKSILEKVGRLCKIYEIQFDKDSCCVYVRCATEKDAGIVHNEINGWWFDKRLVSIKFLRLQRYLARFPKSSGGPHCLNPSEPENVSQCFKIQ